MFAFTLGVLSFIIHPNFITVPKVTESQTIIIEKITNNKIQKNLNKLNQVNYNNKIISLTHELYKSIKYVQIRNSKDEKLHPQCTTFSMNLTDNSIFIKIDPYIVEDKKILKIVWKLYFIYLLRGLKINLLLKTLKICLSQI